MLRLLNNVAVVFVVALIAVFVACPDACAVVFVIALPVHLM